MGPVFYLATNLKRPLLQVLRKSTAIYTLHSDAERLGKASRQVVAFALDFRV